MKTGVTKEKIMSYLVDMHEQMFDIGTRMATKGDLAQLKIEMQDLIEPVIGAVDRDAEMIINHEKRITVLERRSKR